MTSNSSDQLFESLSALVDNEANELEVRRLLKNIEGNPELLERWRRYHLIGSALRREHSMQISGPDNLAQSVAIYINSVVADPTSVAERSADKAADGQQIYGWRELLGKSAIAASFAATLVLGFNFWGSQVGQKDLEGPTLAAVNEASLPAEPSVAANNFHTPVGFELPRPEARTVSTASSGIVMPMISPPSQTLGHLDDITDYATQQMLNQLLIEHAERASAHGSLGIMPFARVSRMQTESAR